MVCHCSKKENDTKMQFDIPLGWREETSNQCTILLFYRVVGLGLNVSCNGKKERLHIIILTFDENTNNVIHI